MDFRLNNYIIPGPLKPLGNQVMIKLRKLDEKTTGGLFVPTADAEKPKEGFVIAAGPGRVNPDSGETFPCPVKEGDLVLIKDFTGEKVDYDGAQHLFIDADALLGVFDGGNVNAASFKPLGDRVLVVCAEQATETTTGIALAVDEDTESNQGEVIAVGPGTYATNGKLQPVTVAAGESVVYARYTGAEAKFDGKRYIVVSEADCIAKW